MFANRRAERRAECGSKVRIGPTPPRVRSIRANISSAAPKAKERSRRRSRSSGRSGKWSHFPRSRIRPCRGWSSRSPPSNRSMSRRISGSQAACRRWLPKSRRWPAARKLPAFPPRTACCSTRIARARARRRS